MCAQVDAIRSEGLRIAVSANCDMQSYQENPRAPALWLTRVFPEQHSPLCLQNHSPAPSAAAAAAAAGQPSKAHPADKRMEGIQRDLLEWQRAMNGYGLRGASQTLQQAIDQLADSSGCSSSKGSSSSSKGSSSSSSGRSEIKAKGAGEQLQEGASPGHARVLADLVDSGYGLYIAQVATPVMGWQNRWLQLAEAIKTIARHRVSGAESAPQGRSKAAGKGLRRRKVSQQRGSEKHTPALQHALLAAGFASDSSDSSSEDAGDAEPEADAAAAAAAAAAATAAAAAAARDCGAAAAPAGDMDSRAGPHADRHRRRSGSKSGSSSSSSKQSSSKAPGRTTECLGCVAEAVAAQMLSAVGLSSSGNGSDNSGGSSSSSQQAAAGLYGALPVPWSDPFMMRRLLWDLLGKLKPTAQAWFKQYADMCPHTDEGALWRMVVLSLARHIWAPPGEWGLAEEQQMQLLLPKAITQVNEQDGKQDINQDAAVSHYARLLNSASQQASMRGSAAAVLSLHALLALDPHGARMQPRPELLFYTPAGFHAAVSKVLLQSSQLPPASDAAAAAGNRDGQQVNSSQQQQQLGEEGVQPHHLQSFSDVLFPAWYMWWHIGLLAYHQQQQQPGRDHLRQLGLVQLAKRRGMSSSEDQTQQQQQDWRPKQIGTSIRLVNCEVWIY
jgi:hypothetical protein